MCGREETKNQQQTFEKKKEVLLIRSMEREKERKREREFTSEREREERREFEEKTKRFEKKKCDPKKTKKRRDFFHRKTAFFSLSKNRRSKSGRKRDHTTNAKHKHERETT